MPPDLRRRLAVWDIRAKYAAILMPVVVAVVGGFLTWSITRIQVGPEFIDLAMEIIAEDPLHQPEGVRKWAVALLTRYSGERIDEDLARRLEGGWSFTVPARQVGYVSVRANDAEPSILDGNRFILTFSVDPETPAVKGLELSMPDEEVTERREELHTTDIVRIHHGPRAYVFRLEQLERNVAHFSVWKQSPSFRQPAKQESPPAAAPARADTVTE
ncbi:MAG TPA: hypothetical protein VJG13_06740 [Thermoanaerobaculia bacterium]|nr:hypothetical protein [Thermoanaerobaculia bacterium]